MIVPAGTYPICPMPPTMATALGSCGLFGSRTRTTTSQRTMRARISCRLTPSGLLCVTPAILMFSTTKTFGCGLFQSFQDISFRRFTMVAGGFPDCGTIAGGACAVLPCSGCIFCDTHSPPNKRFMIPMLRLRCFLDTLTVKRITGQAVKIPRTTSGAGDSRFGLSPVYPIYAHGRPLRRAAGDAGGAVRAAVGEAPGLTRAPSGRYTGRARHRPPGRPGAPPCHGDDPASRKDSHPCRGFISASPGCSK